MASTQFQARRALRNALTRWWCLLATVLVAQPVLAGFFYSGVTPTNLLWPGGLVPYQFETNLTSAQTNTYLNGLREWELAANVKFIPRTNQTQYIVFKYDPAGFDRVSGANPQVVEINSLSRSQICHEMGHSFGFTHEHIRPDRNNFVTVLSNNIASTNLVWFNIDSTGVTNGAYDFESVMHFPRDLFSLQPGDTLQARPGYERFQPRMDNAALSHGDRAALAFLYGPPAIPLTNVVTTTADAGPGSLRGALYYLIDHPGTAVHFNLATNDTGFSNGVFTIHLTGYLPPLVTDGTVIDGSTQPGFNGNPLIIVDGSQILPEVSTVTGLLIYAANCAVKNLSFQRLNWNGITFRYPDATNNLIAGCWCGLDSTGTNRAPNDFQGILIDTGASRNIIGGTNAEARNVLSGNSQYGIWISDSNTTGNVVLGNYVGTDSSGTIAVSNATGGVIVVLGSRSNLIGGASAGARNVMSGNFNFGLWLGGDGTRYNTVRGNYLGLNAAGNAALPNTFAGMYVLQGAQSNFITGNVFSGNLSEGIRLADAGTSGNVVQGNFCGTDPAGTNAIPNGFAGLTIYSNATGNTIGGVTPAARNIISGNGTVGLALGKPGTSGNVVQGNFIGTDVNGSNALPNSIAGVYLTESAQNNTLGGVAAGAGNVVSGNGSYGVYIRDPATSSNLIQGNFIGTCADGTNALGNDFNGIIMFGGAHENVIGLKTDGSGAGNRVAFNASDGIRLDDANTVGNTIRGNAIYSNDGLGIDLAGPNSYGVTANDSGDGDTGPNNLQNYPVITQASVSGNTTTVVGTLDSTPNRPFILDFYRNSSADPSGFGEGEIYAGNTNITTDASGNANFSLGFANSVSNQFFTATATDITTGDTSEFSLAMLATNAPAPPQIVGPFTLGSTGFAFNLALVASQNYRIQASTNLTTWIDLTNFLATGPTMQFVDHTATNFSRRFYRAVSP